MNKSTVTIEPFSMVYLEDYFNNFTTEITKYQWPEPFETVDDAKDLLQEFLNEMAEDEGLFYSVKSEDGRFVGGVEVHGLSGDCPELGVWIIESEHCKGYAYEALSQILELARSKFGKTEFYYEADIRNEGSNKLLKKFEEKYLIIKQGLDEMVTDSGKELKLQGYILKCKDNI